MEGFVQCHENDIPLDSAIDIKDLSQKSEITMLFLEIRIIGDKHINIYILAHRITNGNKTTRATISDEGSLQSKVKYDV
jgi:hypothetical protein